MTNLTTPHVQIEDPQFYLDNPWPTFRWMRENDPFYYYESLDTFVVTRHADIREIVNHPHVFVSSRGIFLNDWKYAGQQAGDETLTDSFFPKGGEQVGTADLPRHTDLRRVIAPAFSPRAIGRIAESLALEVAEMVEGIEPGAVTDWLPFASLVPIRAATKLIGLPDTDIDRVQFWSDELEKLGGDLTLEELQAAAREFQSLQQFIIENIEVRRRNPGTDDLLTVLLNAELDNDKVSEANVVMYAMTMMAAGGDTTRSLLAGIIYHLAQHPAQWELLRGDRTIIPRAIEEALRYVTPARAFGRTAVQDITVNGQEIKAGQRVYLMYMAANRDEEVFPDAEKFDITRKESAQQLALSGGAHICAGARLVRSEAAIVLNALLDRFARVELAGEAVPVVHVIRNGWSTMPVKFHI
ncbi:cytochrome P450 [Williamsia muralis]|uniref:cytochrome P450 n=1 Tax=Williamsia marianensis TaxID=85044 RepID=UPI0016702D0D|nr:cytochrome P450 [Williamsia marianensis]